MSSTGSDGRGGSANDGYLRSSSPLRTAKPKSSSSSLSSQLSAHLSKSVAPRPVPSPSSSQSNSPAISAERRGPVGIQQSGKAVATSADVEDLANSELWKSNAAKRAEKAWATQSEKSLQSDPKFKKYSAAVEKSLASFESVSEWADFISFLGRLLKTFQLSPNVNVIPRKLVVAKRLSQCLNPALPSGVHQRTLDVYEHILTVIGKEGLRRDLLVWTPGLLPFFQYASTSVKPIVLSIFERHYLALAQDLRPATRAFLLATLPGLEEETNEFYDRVLRLLDRTRDSVGQVFFFQNLFLILISSPSARLPTLNYLSKRLPKLNGDNADRVAGGTKEETVSSVIGSKLGLMLRGFAAALEDEASLLVRRAALDILVTHLRLDSPTWKVRAQHEDKIRLVKAALAVVLRRDLSLNRRLYAWILGSSEEVTIQQEYFEEHAQLLSRQAFLSELIQRPLVDVDPQLREREGLERQRPYRIFVSLLDKWSIGQPLTNALILDTFHSLQTQLAGTDDEAAKSDPTLKAALTDISTTAKMLFEVVDPFATYRQFYYAIKEEMLEGQKKSFSAISLLRFVLRSFRVHDEESRQIHVPVLLSVVLELLSHCEDSRTKGNAVNLAAALLHLLPRRIFTRTKEQSAIVSTFLEHAEIFYNSDPNNADEAAQRYIGFQHPLTQQRLLSLCSEMPKEEGVRTSLLRALIHFLHTLDATVDVTTDSVQEPIPWQAHQLISDNLDRIVMASNFDEIDSFTGAIIESARCRALQGDLKLSKTSVAPSILKKLFLFLQTRWEPYHVHTTELVWSIEDLTRSKDLESLLCSGLASTSILERDHTRQVFGTLWQYSSEERLASSSLCLPLLKIFDGLRSMESDERQASERWIKTYNRGYTFFLDPLLHMMATSGLRRIPHQLTYGDQSFAFYRYQSAFDHERVLYALGLILHLARFGSQAFVKTLRSTQMRRSQLNGTIASNAEEGADTTYLHALFASLLLFLRSDALPNNPYKQAFEMMHTTTAEIVQTLTSRGPLQGTILSDVEGTLIERLHIAIFSGSLQGQNALLLALHSVIRAKTSEGSLRDYAPHPLLLITTRQGITSRSNRPVFSHWTDFILSIVPHYRRALTTFLLPLNGVVCLQMEESAAGMQAAYFDDAKREAHFTVTEADLVLLMNINERLLLQCLESANSVSDQPPTPSSTAEKDSGVLGTLSSVFQGETTTMSATSPALSSSNSVLLTLHQSIRALHTLWSASSESVATQAAGSAKQLCLEVINPKIKARCRRSLERIYRNNSGEVVESLIDCWNMAGGSRRLLQQTRDDSSIVTGTTPAPDSRGMEVTFEILSTLAPSAQIVVTFLCDVISSRTSPSAGDKLGKKAFTPIVPESVLLSFWEAYLDRLDGSATVQVWPVVIMLVRDILQNSASHKAQMYPVLRCLTVAGEKILSANVGQEDKKMRRELVDSYVKLCDFNILIAGRSFEQTNWIGRRTAAINEDGNDEYGHATPTGPDEKMAQSLPDLLSGGSVIDSINSYLSGRALPALKKFGVDQDKIVTICTNIVYYIITPSLRQRRKTLDVPIIILRLLTEMTRMSGSIRAWRTAVSDIFQDARFFHMQIESGTQWKPVVLALVNSDKERLVELIAKVSSTPSTNIFTNKEAETTLRATNLRRISYIIYAAERDYWLTHLPPLQEKLVDLLRNGTSDPIGGEVYLCLRVLLLRFSSRHLSAFWPVIITELMRLFESCLDEWPADHSDALQLVFSASKFLDLLLTLQTDDSQAHQWLFVTDTVDAVEPPEDWISDSILDRIAIQLSVKKKPSSRANRQPADRTGDAKGDGRTNTVGSLADGHKDDSFDSPPRKRQPRLSLSHFGPTISSIEELQPFFSSVSLDAYSQLYECGEAIDSQAVDESLERDMFPSEE